MRFTKMHGLGNDFIVIDGVSQNVSLSPEKVQQLADRNRGIGCDQVLIVEPSEKADFFYRIFNADGSEVSQCGNGARCLARFIHQQQLSDKKNLQLETQQGLLSTHRLDDDQVRAEIAIPEHFELFTLPITSPELTGYGVSLGNPHCVVVVENLKSYPVEKQGSDINALPMFPEGVNVGFMQLIDSGNIHLRVFERGAGETQACGSGTCAAVVCGIRAGLLNRTVHVTQPGGELTVDWPNDQEPVALTGSATFVFEGTIE